MMSFNVSTVKQALSKPTSFFGFKLWIIILICIALIIFLILIFTSLCLCCCRRRRHQQKLDKNNCFSTFRRLLPRNRWDIQTPEKQLVYSGDHRQWSASGRNIHMVDIQPVVIGSVVQCKNYTANEIEIATDKFSYGNLIGTGEYGVVYRGLLLDNTRVAVKKLICRSMEHDEFVGEVKAIWCIKHKNLVKLLGYCIDGTKRMLVYEYVDNGNLQQWLHGCIARISPLTWNIRMKIILGTAKGLAFLHEDSEPVVVHEHLKSTNILLDHQWNPRISDIGITKLLGPEWSHSVTCPIGMSGYIAPEYTQAYGFDKKSDVYSFGVLVMEIISGRDPVEYGRFEIEEHLVDWLKYMVENQKFDEIADPKLPEPPTMKELKRIILISLRCVDHDFENRPTMGEVIHMLEPRDLLLSDGHIIRREISGRSFSVEYPELAV